MRVDGLGKILNDKLASLFLEGSIDSRVSIDFSDKQYYKKGNFIIEFYTDVVEIVDERRSGNEYAFIIRNGQITSKLYKTYLDDYGCYKEHESTHMRLVENKELDLIDCIINYNELSLIFSSGKELTKEEINRLKQKYSEFEGLPEIVSK